MIINHNLGAMNANRQMGVNAANAGKSMEKLSSGLRINKAGDDAAGLAISEKMRGQIRGLDQASANAQDGISLVQTAEGALNETTSILQRMRELAVQGSNDTATDPDRKAMQTEFSQLKSEIDRIGGTTEFNTKKLLDGSLSAAGASGGANTVSGAQVFKQTAGNLTGVDAKAVDASGTNLDLTKTDAILVDGKKISVDWNKLSTADKATLQQDFSTTPMTASQSGNIRDILQKTINEAIDSSGTGAAHISITDATAGTFKIESGSTGNDSKVEAYIASSGTNTGNAVLADGTTLAAGSGSTFDTFLGATSEMQGGVIATSGTNNVLDALANTDKFQLSIAGHTMQITSPTAIAGSDANTYATSLQTAINTAITAYNSAAGFTSAEQKIQAVTVTASNGRLSIDSPTGSVELADVTNGSALKKLGLDQTSISSAGTGALTFQIGANQGQTMGVSVNDMRASALGIAGIDLSTQAGASDAITKVSTATTRVSAERSKLGAIQNRLEHTISNLGTSSENLTSAESRIRDVDMAKEMSTFSKNNILSQAAQAMLAQANQQPQQVLQLLR
jgi:flagellin